MVTIVKFKLKLINLTLCQHKVPVEKYFKEPSLFLILMGNKKQMLCGHDYPENPRPLNYVYIILSTHGWVCTYYRCPGGGGVVTGWRGKKINQTLFRNHP